MEYNFKQIENKWKAFWTTQHTFKTSNNLTKPKFYILDMFPYPSGSGLHVGHPLGYIASDIIARYKILKGFNVLHPMGFDSFGLPAEQYAVETGQHPAITTQKNIDTFKTQLNNISFCYDWSKEIQTSSPEYYKWTQYLFIKIFNAWFDRNTQKAKHINELISHFKNKGSQGIEWFLKKTEHFSASEWKNKNTQEQQDILMKYRLAFRESSFVNWCEKLGTVLANDEVINGVSERGGHPVERKKMEQWFLRITEYADRLLHGLNQIDFSDSMKEMQKNWIGKSEGAEMEFEIEVNQQIQDFKLEVYTTRPDTIFGVDFMVVAPEHHLVKALTTEAQKKDIDNYISFVKSRSEVERMAEAKQVNGCFTGAFALNPFNGKKIPIWIAEYVLINYGTGVVMAVPCGDDRDYAFASYFKIPITNIWGALYDSTKAYTQKFGKVQNSDFLTNVEAKEAMAMVINKIEQMGIGKRKINYKMHDAGFSRQRYWGEPFPIIYKNSIAEALDEKQLPLLLPEMTDFKQKGKEGKGPLSNLTAWTNLPNNAIRETDTMPGYAGSSWYFLRYPDATNTNAFCDRKISDYWNQVDLYVGGTEHAVGHLLYSRMWTKILFDLGDISFEEPYKKLLNQGKITGVSKIIYRVKSEKKIVSHNLKKKFQTDEIHIAVHLVDGDILNIEAFKKYYTEYANYEMILENGKYLCGSLIEKMSKSLYNTVNPDDIINQYGADTFRLYEMFLGPVQQNKHWDTKGIEGTHRFLKKLWRLIFDEHSGKLLINDHKATEDELKLLHKTIKKIEDDMERFAFNTSISSFMIIVNTLTELKCYKKEILSPLVIMLSPFAPHIAEELWAILGNTESVFKTSFPVCNATYLIESEIKYPVAINGKVKIEILMNANADQNEVERIVNQNKKIIELLAGKTIKKIIFAKGRMINLVV